MLALVPSRPALLALAATVLVTLGGCSLQPATSSPARPTSSTSTPAAPTPAASPRSDDRLEGAAVLAALDVGDWPVGVAALDVDPPAPPPGWTQADVVDLLERDRTQYAAAYLDPTIWTLPPGAARENYRSRLPAFYAQFLPTSAPADLAGRLQEISIFGNGVSAEQPYLSATTSASLDQDGRLWTYLNTTLVQPVAAGGVDTVVVGRRSVGFAKDRSGPADDPAALYWPDSAYRLLAVDCASFDVGAIIPKTTPYSRAHVEDMCAFLDADGYPDQAAPQLASGLGQEQCSGAASA